MFFDPLYWLLIGVIVALSGLASTAMRGTFKKFSKIPNRRGLTGADVAAAILRANQINDVRIEPVKGHLSDHYDPRKKVLRLSEPVYGERSLAAAGVAAHEVGHAIQHAHNYVPLRFRSAWVPVAGIGSKMSWVLIIGSMLMGGAQTALGNNLAIAGLVLFATTTVFTLITLPVEFDASRRAVQTLQQQQILAADEIIGTRKVLNAAAMTYVAAAAASIMTLLYWAFRLGLFGGRRS
jgi:Zn-dependent membrane protease YugP